MFIHNVKFRNIFGNIFHCTGENLVNVRQENMYFLIGNISPNKHFKSQFVLKIDAPKYLINL